MSVSRAFGKQPGPCTTSIEVRVSRCGIPIQNKLRETRTQLAHELQTGSDETKPEKQAEREQLHVLADYATGIQTALNLEGKLPFEYPGLAGYEALTQIETSLGQLEKKGLHEAAWWK